MNKRLTDPYANYEVYATSSNGNWNGEFWSDECPKLYSNIKDLFSDIHYYYLSEVHVRDGDNIEHHFTFSFHYQKEKGGEK